MGEIWGRLRDRLGPGGTPSLPELYPGEKTVDTVEVAHEPTTSGLDGPDNGADFLDSGRITLRHAEDGTS